MFGPPDQYSKDVSLELRCNDYKTRYKEHCSRVLSCSSFTLQGKHLESHVTRLGPIAFNPAATPDDDDDLHRLGPLMKWWVSKGTVESP